MPRGGARGQNLGHLCKMLYCCVKIYICLYVSSQLSISIDIRKIGAWKGCLSVHRYRLLGSCTGVGLGFKILDTIVKCSFAVFKFFLCLYLNSQLSTSIHIRNMGAWKSRLSVHRYPPLGSCPGVGLGFKIQDISYKVFSAFLLCQHCKHILGNTSANLVALP